MEKIKDIVSVIAEHIRPEKIILFGSYANGKPCDDSDVDLLIIKDFGVPRYQRGVLVRKCLRGIKIPVDILVYTRDEIQKWANVDAAFINMIMKNGKILYG
jgi:predicted nucleotidyltransferase